MRNAQPWRGVLHFTPSNFATWYRILGCNYLITMKCHSVYKVIHLLGNIQEIHALLRSLGRVPAIPGTLNYSLRPHMLWFVYRNHQYAVKFHIVSEHKNNCWNLFTWKTSIRFFLDSQTISLVLVTCDPIYQYRSPLITAWISNHMSSEVGDEIHIYSHTLYGMQLLIHVGINVKPF